VKDFYKENDVEYWSTGERKDVEEAVLLYIFQNGNSLRETTGKHCVINSVRFIVITC